MESGKRCLCCLDLRRRKRLGSSPYPLVSPAVLREGLGGSDTGAVGEGRNCVRGISICVADAAGVMNLMFISVVGRGWEQIQRWRVHAECVRQMTRYSVNPLMMSR